MKGVTRLSDSLLNYVLVSVDLQEGYGFPEELKKKSISDMAFHFRLIGKRGFKRLEIVPLAANKAMGCF
ncbi:hypothetical protein J7L97_01715 [Candidatus Bathyarchaeota archaeon]|nr:hypothetical protein [Candidatus Bathyarchaeota archaeon]